MSTRFPHGYAVLAILRENPAIAEAIAQLPQEERFEMIESIDLEVDEIVNKEKRAALLRIANEI
jgi:hypothetical protein